jgi:23S rRNA (adenine2030-N6)-methyltransferase
VRARIAAPHGAQSYPGSPMIAAHLLRPGDTMHLAELHPGEHAALDLAMSAHGAKCHRRDGFEMAHALCPPTPRRGVMLIDPSYEIKTDYTDIPRHITRLARAWNVGIIALWYPILASARHRGMLDTLSTEHPEALRHEVHFPPARAGHGMIGSGLFVLRAPYGLDVETRRLSCCFEQLKG